MSHALRTLLSAATLAGAASAQQVPQPTALTVPAPIHAGTYYAATGQFVPASPGAPAPDGANDVIFNSNYYTGFFYDISDGTVVYDEGRVPSTTSPDLMGTADSYRITGMQIAYATDSLLPVSMRVRMWHSYDTCSDPSLLPAPIADITLTNMPGTIQAGAFTPYTFDINMAAREFCLLAEGDRIYNEGGVAGDRFGFALEVLDGGDGTETGPIVGLRPGPFAPTGDGTVFQNPGAAAGSGLGAVDQWYDVGPSTPTGPLAFTTTLPGTFVDISGTGTALVFADPDDGAVNFTSTVGNAEFPAGTVRVGANGGIRFGSATGSLSFSNAAVPATGGTIFGGGNVLLPFWDDLRLAPHASGSGQVFWQEIGGVLYIQWNNVAHFSPTTNRMTFQVQIPSTGSTAARFVYSSLVGSVTVNGSSATIGRQNSTAPQNQPFSFNQAGVVSNGTVISLAPGPIPGPANCYNWGGYNPPLNVPAFGSFWLVLESDLNVNCVGCANLIDDALEPNDTCLTAVAVGVPSVVTNLVVDNADDDFYAFTVPANTALRAQVDFLHSQADIDLVLFADDCMTVLDSSGSVSNQETVDFFNCSPVPVVVILRVFEFGQNACGDYSMTTTLDASCATDDLLEPNDNCGQTFPISLGFTPNLRIKPCNEDYYFLDADPGETLNLGIFFSHAVADLDMYLYSAGANCGTPAGILTSSVSATNDEFITWTNTTGQVQNYVLFVDFFAAGSANCATYQLAYTRDPSTEIGFQFCTAQLNSTNRGAHVFATGSDVVSNNDVTLGCRFLPNNSNGYFLNNQTTVFIPFPGGSVGNLCIGGGSGVGRFNANVLNSGPAGGQVTLPINLTAIPRPAGFVSIMPGQTWYFQYWYRDAIPAVVSNWSDAVGITFLAM